MNNRSDTEVKGGLDLKNYPFPNLSRAEMAFSTLAADKVLLKEAELRGFDKHYNPYCRFFSKLFFSGGQVVFKEGIDPEFKEVVWNYLRALMSSWEPKHEHKEAICAMLLSELCELPKES